MGGVKMFIFFRSFDIHPKNTQVHRILWKGDGGDWLEGHPERDLVFHRSARIRAAALADPAPEDKPAGRTLTWHLAAQ